jgi:PAS domain S-box-containing protein
MKVGSEKIGQPTTMDAAGDGAPEYGNLAKRDQAEAALRESEQRYRHLVHSLPGAIYTCDAQGRITLYNEAAAALWGRRPDLDRDLWCGSWRTYDLDGAPIPREECPMAQSIREGCSLRGREIIIERPDGSRSHVLPNSNPVHDESGAVVGGISIIVDLTESKRAMEHLREKEQWHQAVFEQTAVGVAQMDAVTGRFIHANQPYSDIVGYTRKEMEQLSFADITHEQDVGLGLETAAKMRDGSIREFTQEKRYVRKDRSIVWVSVSGSSIGPPGKPPTSLIVVVQDITERKKTERETQRQAAFARFNPNPVLELSSAGDVIYFNGAAREMARTLGAESPSQILPTNISRIVRDCLATARVVRLETQTNGRTISWLFFPVPLNKVVHCSAGDITEHKRMEEHFLQAQKMEALGQFSGGVAHDFNNILAVIGGYTELSRTILEGNPAVREHLGAVQQATSRAADLVRQILTFSSQQPQERQAIQLQPILLESLSLLRATIPSTIEFETSVATDAPMVFANANQIHQILMNLGTNAWHSMKDGTGRLRVRLERYAVDEAHAVAQPQLRPGLYARVSVSDTGSGMDQATLRRIFEPFFTTKPPGEGTGLGLAVVHGIMESHDGAVTVYSQPGEGAIFHLYFPAHVGKAAPPADEDGHVPRGHGERILVVDDEEMLARLGQMTLEALGYEVDIATKPSVALAMLRADPQRYALVLTDQTMPGMSGLLLASQLREIRPGLPIILMTGYSASLTPERIEASGIRQLLLKPTTLHSLGTAVSAAVSAQAKA